MRATAGGDGCINPTGHCSRRCCCRHCNHRRRRSRRCVQSLSRGQQVKKRQCSVCRAGESWCGEAAQLPVDKGGVVVRVRCYAMAAKQACLPNALALPGRAVRVLCGPRCFRCVLTKTSQCRPPIQLWPAKPLVSRPRLQMPKSLHHQHPFSQQHPFCTRFPAPFRPCAPLTALFLHFWRHLRIPFLSSSPSPRLPSTPIPY